ncbi:tRNA lysidine(34) synthetase TilS [Amaricoccus solimangrovi]|uniref:tRNA lysidine(34) synthetase TilS n=1 Tax=Amaricoccus solimangrovi TaxID=2589815 RepID=UPI0015E3EB6E|nr:tRNA lysidine(34) synthetase TilS [Amaricoccus solimangrovi]
MTGAAPLLDAVSTVLARAPAGPLVVGFSGGGDSTALLLLTLLWARERGREVIAATVDHGLRPESAAEAREAAAFAAARGIAQATLRWTGWDGAGNLEDAARRARRRLIGGFARARGAGAVLLGHTLDDQAETFLMRLARGSGVDGLSGMRAETDWDRLPVLRPMLGLRREALRDFLRAEGVGWIEDPSNRDPRFARVRFREVLGTLDALGLGAGRLAETAAAMGRAREALETATAELARGAVEAGPAGDALLDLAPTLAAPREIGLRLFAATLGWVSGARYRPRLASLERAFDGLAGGAETGATLHGCLIRRRGTRLAIRREPARVAPAVPLAERRWDGRWEWAGGAVEPGLSIGALGAAGLAECGDWRARGARREALLSTPALWRGSELVAAPLARPEPAARFARISALPPPWDATLLR